MTEKLNADARVKMAIGSQFVEIQVMQDRIEELSNQLADAVVKIAELEKGGAAAPNSSKTPAA